MALCEAVRCSEGDRASQDCWHLPMTSLTCLDACWEYSRLQSESGQGRQTQGGCDGSKQSDALG
eukprot:3931691-Rhodomonas_salina.2